MGQTATRASRFSRLLRWAWRLFWLALLSLIVALHLASRAANRRLARQLSDLARAGELATIEDLIPRVPPGAANAADTYQRAFQALSLSHDEERLLLGGGTILYSIPPKPPQDWSGEELAVARAAIERNASYFEQLDEASRIRDCAFPVRWRRIRGSGESQLPCMLWAGMMLRGRAAVLAEEGRADQALAACDAILRLADDIQREPALISQHVGYSLQELAVDAIELALNNAQPSPAACQLLSDHLAAVDLVAPSLRAAQGELAIFGLPVFDYHRPVVYFPGAEETRSRGRPLLARVAPGLALDLDELSYLEFITEARRALARPWPESQQVAEQADRKLQRLPQYRAPISKRVAPPISPELLHRENTIARLGAARIGLALGIFRLRQGRYPDSLAELRAAGWELPADPFSEQAYHYRRAGAGFLVYSVGADREDDGGRASAKQALQGLLQEQPPDPNERADLPFAVGP